MLSGFVAKACASSVVKVDLPTPPLPLSTRILCFTSFKRAEMREMSGSGPLGAEAHIAWFGQPAHESAVPAAWESAPGQCSGSGATRFGFAFKGLARTSSTRSGSSSVGAMVKLFRTNISSVWCCVDKLD